ncbi:MAG TPA: hypothetical protein PLX06_01055 [Fimbriimonadaceae bacterium]|nr:hypothetical protein [Fimbriimonadaceae bacterium]
MIPRFIKSAIPTTVSLACLTFFSSLCGCQSAPVKPSIEPTAGKEMNRPTPLREEIDEVAPVRDKVHQKLGSNAR